VFEDGEDVAFLCRVEGAAFGDVVPFLEAAAAAGRCGVLGDEGGVVAHGRLLAVVRGVGGRESFVYEVGCVFEHDAQALRAEVGEFLPAQFESAAELRFAERSEEFFKVSHVFALPSGRQSWRRKLTTARVRCQRASCVERAASESDAENFPKARRVL
jgi:hypothetical protein